MKYFMYCVKSEIYKIRCKIGLFMMKYYTGDPDSTNWRKWAFRTQESLENYALHVRRGIGA